MRFLSFPIRTILSLSMAFLSFAALEAQSRFPQQEAALAMPAGFEEQFSSFAGVAETPDPADAVCQRQAAGSAIVSPPSLYSSNGVLTVNFSFKTTVDRQGLTRYCYAYSSADGTISYQAPNLRVTPGDQLVIHFTNALPASGAGTAQPTMAGMVMNPDTANAASGCNATSVSSASTNLHFHGLNVSPACAQDEVIHTIIQPQQEFTYTVQIPANEPSGLYWYHPHPHGFSQNQVLGGATGLIVVEGIQNFNPLVAGLPERVLVVRDQALSSAELAISGHQPGNDLSLNYVPVTYPNYVAGTISTPVGTKEFWRVANTAANSLLNLAITDNGVAQALQIVAVDGVPLTDSSGNSTTASPTSIVVPPGGRVEFIYVTPKQGDTAQLVTQTWNNGPQGDADPGRPLANIVASSANSDGGLTKTNAEPAATIPAVTQSLPALRFKALTAAATVTPTVQRTLYFSIKSDFSQFYITVDGQTPTAFNMDGPPSLVVRSGTVEQWTIQNRSLMDHAFHIHQIHFRTLEVNGSPVTDYTERDTVDVPHWSGNASDPYPSVTLLMDFSDPGIVGTFVYHCHILSHEDLGMMASIQVLPPLVDSTTKLAVSAPAVAKGANDNFTATVSGSSGTPTGSVNFTTGSRLLGTVNLNSSGVALLSTIYLPTGTYPVIATYSGDTTYSASTSSPVTVTVGPYISVLSINYGAPGATVTIGGSNFGATQGSSTLTFNGVKASPSRWADTVITTSVPAAAAGAGNIVVTVGGVASNGTAFTVEPALTVTRVSPLSGSVGSLVTITGTNLLDAGPYGTVAFNGTFAKVLSQSSTSIQVDVPAGATTGPIHLHVNGIGYDTVPFTVISATIPPYSQGFTTTGLTLNGGAKVNGTALQLTDGGSSEVRSAYFNTPVNVQAFTTDFDFQLANATADGFTFVIQNQGLTALGSGGGQGLGYQSIGKSIAVKFDIYSNAGEGSDSTGVYINGALPTLPATNLSGSGIVLSSGHVLHAHISYDGATLTLKLTDTATGAAVSESYTVNIPSVVGGNTAYVGFTGASGGLTATQNILDWSYSASQPAYTAGFSTQGLVLNGGAKVSGTGLQLTDGGSSEVRSAYFNTPVNVQAFNTDFDFQLVNAVADGFTFVIQNQGLTALSSGGGQGLGYQSIGKSVAVKFDIYSNAGEGNDSTGLYTNGALPTLPATNLSGSGIVLSSSHVIHAHIGYDGATLTLKLTDATTAATVTESYAVNIPSIVGGNTAYIGFTGASGGLTATQNILNWGYTPGN